MKRYKSRGVRSGPSSSVRTNLDTFDPRLDVVLEGGVESEVDVDDVAGIAKANRWERIGRNSGEFQFRLNAVDCIKADALFLSCMNE